MHYICNFKEKYFLYWFVTIYTQFLNNTKINRSVPDGKIFCLFCHFFSHNSNSKEMTTVQNLKISIIVCLKVYHDYAVAVICVCKLFL